MKIKENFGLAPSYITSMFVLIYWIRHAEMTEMQIFLEFWPILIISLIFSFTLVFAIEKFNKRKNK